MGQSNVVVFVQPSRSRNESHAFSHLFYPFYWGSVDSSLVLFGLIPITATLGPIAAYNVHLLFSFAAAGFSMFLLARHFLRDRLAAFLAGTIYTFCAHHFAHGWSHLHIYANYWLPLVILLFVRLLERPTLRRGSLLGIVYGLSALTSWTLAVMSAFSARFISCLARERSAGNDYYSPLRRACLRRHHHRARGLLDDCPETVSMAEFPVPRNRLPIRPTYSVSSPRPVRTPSSVPNWPRFIASLPAMAARPPSILATSH